MPDLLYEDIRGAVLACGWGPLHLCCRRGLWIVEAGSRRAVGLSPGRALVALLVVFAGGEA